MAVVYWRGWYMLLGMSPSGVLVGQCERYDNMLRVNVLLLVGSDLAGSCCFVVGFLVWESFLMSAGVPGQSRMQ